MFTTFLISVIGISGIFGLQIVGNYTCNSGSTCLPLSECLELKSMVNDNSLLNYARSFFCGYFHEPYVCCDRNCKTPNGNYGKSVRLDDCPHLKANELTNDTRMKLFLSKSRINRTHVCCNQGENTFTPVPPIPTGNPNVQSSPQSPSGISCITPNGETAECKNINECEAYKAVATDTDINFRFINDSFCGFWEEPMVCCGSVSFYKENYDSNLPSIQNCGIWDSTLYPTIPPWLTLITKRKSSKICIGALINPEYVLAAMACVGNNHKELDIKIAECINDETQSACKFQIKKYKAFPLHAYRLTEDLGVILLKLDGQVRNIVPVCLPTTQLADRQDIEIVGLEKNVNWVGRRISTLTISNDLCHNAMQTFVERIVCIKDKSFCSDNKTSLLQNFVLYNERDRWYLEGLFNRENCYGSNQDYFNTIYLYKFVPWIKSNIY